MFSYLLELLQGDNVMRRKLQLEREQGGATELLLVYFSNLKENFWRHPHSGHFRYHHELRMARLNTWYLVGWTSHDIGCECNFNLGGLMLLVSLLLIGVGWTLKFRFLQMLWIQLQMILQWRCMIKTTTWVWFNFIGRRFNALQICKILKVSEDFNCPGLVRQLKLPMFATPEFVLNLAAVRLQMTQNL